MDQFKSLIVAVVVSTFALAGLVRAANVGYYDMVGSGQSFQVPPITLAGQTPILLNDLTATDLASIDVLFITESSNTPLGFYSEYTNRFSAIQTAVQNGMILVIHNRGHLGGSLNTQWLPGGAGFLFERVLTLHAHIDVLDNSTIVTNGGGPGGVVGNSTLDGGCSSNHGYTSSASLPGSAKRILSNSNPSQIVTFSYPFGYGHVIYSSIPLDFYLRGSNCNNLAIPMRNYAVNVIAYAASLLNGFPIANAGPDQTIDELTTVNLNGSLSSDPDGDLLTFDWIQTAGPTVALSGGVTATPSFVAPEIAAADVSKVLTFELTVSDGQFFSSDTIDIIVKHINVAPVADAGNDANAREGVTYTLNGSHSFDFDGEALTYKWTQKQGTPVTLTPSDSVVNPQFVVPLADGVPLLFQLQVSDGYSSSVLSSGTNSDADDTVQISSTMNNAPIANAGSPQTKDEDSEVILNSTGSSDPDGDGITYKWTQTAGSVAIVLNDDTSPTPKFFAPAVSPGGENYEFKLVVTDDYLFNQKSSSPSEVVVTVRNINDPPNCNLARPSLNMLWPPDHKMHRVEINGVTDADSIYNSVNIMITAITQDEPVNGLGDGDTSPDAVIQPGVAMSGMADAVLIRSERSGHGNGRVYNIQFAASDGFESCNGSVQVLVPHSRKSTPVDSGQTVDSTVQ